MTNKEILTVVEQKFEEVHELVYDEMDGTHPLLVEMWEVFEKLKSFTEEKELV